jgi:hypothetical protein
MRASIPAILILFIMVIKTLTLKNNIDNVNQNKFLRIIVIIILLIGSITPLHEIYRSVNAIYFDKSITRLYDNWVSLDYGGDEEKIETMPNFIVSNSSTPIFFRYFGK